MSASEANDGRWQPHPCPAAGCGQQLQAKVAYCPFCGARMQGAVVASTAETAPASSRDPLLVDAARQGNHVPPVPQPPATPPPAAAPPPPPSQSAPVPAEDQDPARSAAQPPALPPIAPAAAQTPAVPSHAPTVPKPKRTWLRVSMVALAVVVAFAWLRPASEPEWIAQCDTLTGQAEGALAAGDVERAESNLARARTTCQAERLDALSPLAIRIAKARDQAKACSATEVRALSSLDSARPSQAQRLLLQKSGACAGRPAYDALLTRAVRQAEEAASLVAAGSTQLDNGDMDAAEQSLTRALQADSQANGAERLRLALGNARRQVAAATTVPTAAPAISADNRSPAQATEALVADLLRDGRDALARKNYAEAMSNAKSALRLSPGNRAASDLLRNAESAEQQALQEIIIN